MTGGTLGNHGCVWIKTPDIDRMCYLAYAQQIAGDLPNTNELNAKI